MTDKNKKTFIYVVQPVTLTARVYRVKKNKPILLGAPDIQSVVTAKQDVVKWLLPETGRVEGV